MPSVLCKPFCGIRIASPRLPIMISPQEFTHKKTAQYTIRGTFICLAEAARIEYGFLRLAAASPPEPRPITSYNYEAISQMQLKQCFILGVLPYLPSQSPNPIALADGIARRNHPHAQISVDFHRFDDCLTMLDSYPSNRPTPDAVAWRRYGGIVCG